MAMTSANLYLTPQKSVFWSAAVLMKRNLVTDTEKKKKNKNKPLDGITILDMTRVLAGPYCTMILGDLGANVVKVEKPKTGDDTRSWGPPFVGTESCYFLSVNRNKRSVCINIKSTEGQLLLKKLAVQSDVFIENFIPGVLDKLGLGYEDLAHQSPKLIYCSISGYGSNGPYKKRPGYDVIAASVGGLMSVTGPEDGDPSKVGVAMTDLAAGLYAHGSIMAALIHRQKTGKGQKIEIDLLSTQLASLVNIGSSFLNAGAEPKRWGTAHESIVPYQSFKTNDGYITFGAGNDSQFKALCEKLEVLHLATDPKFITNQKRVENRKELIAFLAAILIQKRTETWLEVFEGSSFPYGPLNKVSEAFGDPHVKTTGIVKNLSHRSGQIKVVGPPVTYSMSVNEVSLPPPLLGQHTDEVLGEMLGLNKEEIVRLRECQNNTVRLTLTKPKSEKKVVWANETVDNEHLGKKKSKCCCIYTKPHKFGESSSESEDECNNCNGHVESKKGQKKKSHHSNDDHQTEKKEP